ncbi:MAG: helix-turn-helix transcriptional regulator [Bacteroidota bacterium]
MKQPGFGKKVAQKRKAKKLTQYELAKACGVNVRTIQRIESGGVTPRSYTVRVISKALDNQFIIDEKNASRFNQFFNQAHHAISELFNFKTNVMRKSMILTGLLMAIGLGIFSLVTKIKAQDNQQINYTNFVESHDRGIIYFFPRDAKGWFSNVKDTADYRFENDLIQEYESKIFFNGSFLGKVLKGDTVIYVNNEVQIRSNYWKFTSSYGTKIHYLIPNGTPIDNLSVQSQKKTENLYIGDDHIRETNYKIFLNENYQGSVQAGDTVIYNEGEIEILN